MRALVFLLLFMSLFSGCIQPSEQPTTTTTTSTLPCDDSDGGADILQRGTASGFPEDGNLTSEEDYCVNSDQLIEFFCDEKGYLQSDIVSCKNRGFVCSNGECTEATTTTTTTTTTSSTTTSTTILGECITGGCGESYVFYRCKTNMIESFDYVERVSVVPYCADAGTPQAKCKVKETPSVEDRCERYEVCVEGLQVCQTADSVNATSQ